jgi:hypothetical protein
MLTKIIMKKCILEHYGLKPFFEKKNPESILAFRKRTKINVQFRKAKRLSGKLKLFFFHFAGV